MGRGTAWVLQAATVLTGVLLLFVLLYPTSLLRKEAFRSNMAVVDPEARVSAANLAQRDQKQFCAIQSSFEPALADAKNTLLYRACVSIKDEARDFQDRMKQYMNTADFYVTAFHTRTNSFESVMRDIRTNVADLCKFNGEGHRVKGPVYALIVQAPFYRDLRTGVTDIMGEDGQIIHVQPFSLAEFNWLPAVVLRDKSAPYQPMENADGIAVSVYIMYPLYEPSRLPKNVAPEQREQFVNSCLNHWLQHSVTKAACKIKCPNHDGYICGCLNTDTPYKSFCLGPSKPTDKKDKAFVTYGVLYRVNENTNDTKDLFDASAAYTDNIC